jgi:tRNA 2-selenouridine synthase
MPEIIQIEEFIERSSSVPIVDVRSPSEFAQGHIPGALNIPLFNDEERRVVGTTYKRDNRESAMYRGLEFVGLKLVQLAGEGVRAAGGEKRLLVHCWRGGMRSASMAWLFETMGIQCALLEGGYKNYRRYVRSFMEQFHQLRVIGGKTGSGKTAILQHLEAMGEQVIDLEGLAHHKGSAFGALGESGQPTTEQFENDLGRVIAGLDQGKVTWIEDESRNIGRCVIPVEFYEQMRQSETLFLDIPREQRAGYLVSHYADYDKEALKACITKINRKLGGDRTMEALEAVDSGDFYQTAMITLHYYDKSYMHSLEQNHTRVEVVRTAEVDPLANALLLQKKVQKHAEIS